MPRIHITFAATDHADCRLAAESSEVSADLVNSSNSSLPRRNSSHLHSKVEFQRVGTLFNEPPAWTCSQAPATYPSTISRSTLEGDCRSASDACALRLSTCRVNARSFTPTHLEMSKSRARNGIV